MGNIRPRPKRLAEKLLQIRIALGLSQPKMLRKLGVDDQIDYTMISKYELDKNEPPLKFSSNMLALPASTWKTSSTTSSISRRNSPATSDTRAANANLRSRK